MNPCDPLRSLYIENVTGVSIGFVLVGAPYVAENTIIRWNGRDFDYCAVSPISLHFKITSHYVIFQLKDITIEGF